MGIDDIQHFPELLSNYQDQAPYQQIIEAVNGKGCESKGKYAVFYVPFWLCLGT